MNEWIVRVLPLPIREVADPGVTALTEVARFRLRIVAPQSRPGPPPMRGGCEAVDVGAVRVLALDSANPRGGVGGSLDSWQAAWLIRELERSRDRYVVVATYDSSLTMTSDRVAVGTPPRVMGPEVCSILLAHRSVIAWVSGTMHHRAGLRHGAGEHGFWELPGSTEGRDAPLAGGLSVAVERERAAVVMRGALATSLGPVWQVCDPLAAATAAGRTARRGARR